MNASGLWIPSIVSSRNTVCQNREWPPRNSFCMRKFRAICLLLGYYMRGDEYKPLQSIILKRLIYSAPKWHNRMLLRLQNYSLNVAYKKGKEMYLADTRVEPSFQRLTHARTSRKNWRKSDIEHSPKSVLNACNRSNMRQPINKYYSNSVQPYVVDEQKANQKI